MIETLSTQTWDEPFSSLDQQMAVTSLECGKVLFFPQLNFKLSPEEAYFLSPNHVDPRSKNIGYHPLLHKLWGVQRLTDPERAQLKNLLDRFAQASLTLIQMLFPAYVPHLKIARTSFRPVEISGRKTSYRKDDKRLHVDAFPSAPNQGQRILRVFTNINPQGEDRIWRLGEPFETVAKRFLPAISKPLRGKSMLLRLLRITKSYRTLYDHYMLHMHDRMKADEVYQKKADQQVIGFPPGSSWIVQTDQVSHAAMQGQYVLEQTFYLPIAAMHTPAHSPLKVLERLLGARLV